MRVRTDFGLYSFDWLFQSSVHLYSPACKYYDMIHSNLIIKDGIYGMLSNMDKKKMLQVTLEKPDLPIGLDQKLDEILPLSQQNTPINSE